MEPTKLIPLKPYFYMIKTNFSEKKKLKRKGKKLEMSRQFIETGNGSLLSKFLDTPLIL